VRKIIRSVSAIGLTAAATMSIGAATAATSASAAGSSEGCPLGDVCIYPQNAGWNGGHPSAEYYHYGAYNLVNQLGTHRFFNNQTGGAVGHICTGYNGGGTCLGQPAGTWSDDNFTPINSVTLTTH
jgi:hypothetical protein